MTLNPLKISEPNDSMYQLEQEHGLGTGSVALDGSTGELASTIVFTKPRKELSLGVKITGAVTGDGLLQLLNSDDEVVASCAITSGATGVVGGTEVFTYTDGTSLPAGWYNVNVATALTTGDGIPFTISKEAYQEGVAD